jgi:hypothetical protein
MLPMLRFRSCLERRNHDIVIENPDCPSASSIAAGSAVRTASIERENKIGGCVVGFGNGLIKVHSHLLLLLSNCGAEKDDKRIK